MSTISKAQFAAINKKELLDLNYEGLDSPSKILYRKTLKKAIDTDAPSAEVPKAKKMELIRILGANSYDDAIYKTIMALKVLLDDEGETSNAFLCKKCNKITEPNKLANETHKCDRDNKSGQKKEQKAQDEDKGKDKLVETLKNDPIFQLTTSVGCVKDDEPSNSDSE